MKFPCYITISINEMTEKEQASKTSLHKVTDTTLSQAIFFYDYMYSTQKRHNKNLLQVNKNLDGFIDSYIVPSLRDIFQQKKTP